MSCEEGESRWHGVYRASPADGPELMAQRPRLTAPARLSLPLSTLMPTASTLWA